MSAPLLAFENVSKQFVVRRSLMGTPTAMVHAVDGVSFSLEAGETLALVGESGCGKSTTGRLALRLIEPSGGTVRFNGQDLAALSSATLRRARAAAQLIFQDPYSSLNPRMTAGETLAEPLLLHTDLSPSSRRERVAELLGVVGLRREHAERYPHEFSGGQRQRLAIARALAVEPKLIVCDEPVSALDVSIQSQVLNLLLDLRHDFNLTYLFISHNLSVVQYFSDRVGVMYLGKLVEEGAVEQLYRNPRHPYTVALLSAIPDADPRRRKKRLVLKGDVPSPAAPPSGCRFHTRCWLYEKLGNPERCVTEEPLLRAIGEKGHQTACHYAEEVSETVVESVAATQSAIETAVAEPA